MKILYISELLKGGGAELFLYNLVSGIKEELKDLNIDIVTADRVNSNLYLGLARIHHVPRDPLYFQSRVLGFGNPIVKRKLINVMKEVKPNIIHVNNVAGFGLAVLEVLNEVCNVPVIWTLHDHWMICSNTLMLYKGSTICNDNLRCIKDKCIKVSKYLPSKFSIALFDKRFQYLQRYGLRDYVKNFALVAVSKYLANIVSKFLNVNNVTVIYNGTVFKEAIMSEESWVKRRGMAYLGGPRMEKGYEIVKECIRVLAEKGILSSLKTYIRGRPEDFAYFLDKYRENLVVRSYFDDVTSIYSSSLLTLIPSIWPESLPYTAIEALGHGTLVVAFNVGGIPEVLDDGDLLVQYGDVEGFITKTLMILDDPESYYDKALKLFMRTREKFSVSRMVKNYIELYHRVLRHE